MSVIPDTGSLLVDAAILERLELVTAVPVKDGWFPTPVTPLGEPVVIDIPLPYASFMSSFGDDSEPRVNGRNAQREKFFRLYVVGATREQTVAAVCQLRAVLEGHRLVVDEDDARRVGIIKVDSSPIIFRDDGVVRTDGSPIFSALDNYTVRFPIRRLVAP